MSDISNLSSDSADSWNRDFEPNLEDFLAVRSPIPLYINQSNNQSDSQFSNQTAVNHGYNSYVSDATFTNEMPYDWRSDSVQTMTSYQPVNQYSNSYNQPTNQSNNQYQSRNSPSSNASPVSSELSQVIATAQSITVPTLSSMNLANNSNSSKRKRKNSPERSSNESVNQSSPTLNRAEVKRQKHREIDAVRRQREATVISRLQELNAEHTALFEQAESSLAEPSTNQSNTSKINQSNKRSTSPSSSRSAATSHSKDKVSVLEETAEKTAALQELCRKLTETCAKQQQSINHLTNHVTTLSQKMQVQADDALTFNQSTTTTTTTTATSMASSTVPSIFSGIELDEAEPITQHFSALPARAQEYLGQMDRSFALYSSCFLQATVCIMIISVKTGRLIDANSCFFRTSGWTAEHIIGRVLTAPIEFVLGKRTSSMTEVERLVDEQTRPLVRRNGQLVPARRVPQYPRSKQKFKDLVMGVADQIEAIWRSELADGNMYEVKNICYSGKRESVVDERGRVTQRPVHVVFACSALDGIKLT